MISISICSNVLLKMFEKFIMKLYFMGFSLALKGFHASFNKTSKFAVLNYFSERHISLKKGVHEW